jgi:hypothetical protein
MSDTQKVMDMIKEHDVKYKTFAKAQPGGMVGSASHARLVDAAPR